MPSEEISEPVYYTSSYRHGVDEKRRVQIPAKWRPARPEVLTLLLWPKGTLPEACLLVLPPQEWLALVQKLKAISYAVFCLKKKKNSEDTLVSVIKLYVEVLV